jgi:hypothetical protein
MAYFFIGLVVSQCCFQQSRLKVMNDSINRLIIIELITETQFNLLHDKIKSLEKKSKPGLVWRQGYNINIFKLIHNNKEMYFETEDDMKNYIANTTFNDVNQICWASDPSILWDKHHGHHGYQER